MEDFTNRLGQLVFNKPSQYFGKDRELEIYDRVTRLVNITNRIDTNIETVEQLSDNELHFKSLNSHLAQYSSHRLLQLVQTTTPNSNCLDFEIVGAEEVAYGYGSLSGKHITFYNYDESYCTFFYFDIPSIQSYLQSIVNNLKLI